MNALAWGAKVSPQFRERVRDIAADIGTDPSGLMACMAFETGRTFSPSVRNPSSSATGLIQFMADTARDLGTTVDDLARMTAEDQLEYVHRYFKPFRGRLGSLGDCYMAILWPAAVGRPDDYVVFSSGKAAYQANAALDIDKDGGVTKSECCAFVERMLSEGLQQQNVAFEDAPRPAASKPAETTQQPQTKAPSMPLPIIALISAFGPLLAQLIPTVAKAFDKTSDTPAKIEAATKIIETVVTATNSTNVQEAVEKMQSDPVVLTTARNAVVTEPQILGLLEIGGGIDAARSANLEAQLAPKSFLHNPALWITLVLLVFPSMLLMDVFYVHPDAYSGELRTQIVTGIMGIILVVCGYWLGTSAGSMRKTDIIANQQVQK